MEKNRKYRAMAPLRREGKEQTFWAPVGVAFQNTSREGGEPTISIRLDTLPLGGEIVLFPEDRDSTPPERVAERKSFARYLGELS